MITREGQGKGGLNIMIGNIRDEIMIICFKKGGAEHEHSSQLSRTGAGEPGR
jgi:hypothetical protein